MANPTLPLTPTFTLRFDGSCPKNPGPMGIGYTLSSPLRPGLGQGVINEAGPLVRVGAQVGEGTNNIAEYHALIGGVRHAIRLGMWGLDIETDSQLVERQILGAYKVRDSFLKRLHAEARDLLSLVTWDIRHIFREGNAEADKLSRETVWEEPTLPPPPVVNGKARAFQEFQAAFVRHWWRAGFRNSYLLARIFGVAPTQIEHIGNGTSYKDAAFVLPAWADGTLPLPETVMGGFPDSLIS